MNLDTLHWVILVPAFAGLLCYILGRTGGAVSRIIAVLAAVVTAALAADVVVLGGLPHRPEAASWLKVGGIELSIALAATKFTGWLTVAAMGFGLLIVVYSLRFCAGRLNEGRYYACILWSLAGAAGALLSDNLLLLLISWEVVTLMLYLLVGLGPPEASRKAAAKTFAMLGLSDCAMLLGIAFIWNQTGSLSIAALSSRPIVPTSGLTIAAFVLMAAAALAKAGAMPLHTWVPAAAEAAPTPVMAFLPASLDKLLGIYLLAVISFGLFDLTAAPSALRVLLMVIGAVTILGAVGMAMIQHDLKKLLSFHAVSQVGYMVLGIGTGIPLAVAGGLFHMINHATYKCCLFLGAGSVEHRTGTTQIERLGGLARAMPITFITMTIAAMSISGVPPFNGFASKWLVYQGVLGLKGGLAWMAPFLVTAAVFGSALTLASFVKVIYGMFLGRKPTELAEWDVREAPPTMWAPMVVLAAVCVFFGVFARWPIQHLLLPALGELGALKGAASAAATGQALAWTSNALSVATLLLVLGLGVGAVVILIGRAVGAMKVREADVYLGGDFIAERPSELHRVPATGFYQTVRRLVGLEPVYDHAEQGAFDAYHVGGSYGKGLVEALRRLHTGMLPLYVGWCALGLGVILAVILAVR